MAVDVDWRIIRASAKVIVGPVEGRQANGDIESAAGKAMNGLTLAAQVAGVAWAEVGPGSR
jgi:hypothetical protein